MTDLFGVNLPWLRERIVVIDIHGPLNSGARVSEQVRLLQTVSKDRKARAAVIDVDSPGGSAALSEHLQRAVVRLAKRKPVIAHIRNLGLSGGYLVACGATKVIAPSTAIIGSIGVIISRPVVRELMERMGVKMFVSRVGEYKDMMQPWREPTDEEEEKINVLRDQFYEWFINQVAETRNMEPKRVRECATGEFFIAQRAKVLGLIDDIGDLDTALDMASELGKVPREVSHVRPRRALLDRLISPVTATVTRQVMSEIEAKLSTKVELRDSQPRRAFVLSKDGAAPAGTGEDDENRTCDKAAHMGPIGDAGADISRGTNRGNPAE